MAQKSLICILFVFEIIFKIFTYFFLTNKFYQCRKHQKMKVRFNFENFFMIKIHLLVPKPVSEYPMRLK